MKQETPYKHIYLEMKKTGELFEVFDNMVGNWSEDKNNFISQQNALESLSINTEVYE